MRAACAVALCGNERTGTNSVCADHRDDWVKYQQIHGAGMVSSKEWFKEKDAELRTGAVLWEEWI